MNDRKVKIREKIIQLSSPYQARFGKLVGRESEMKKVLAAWMAASIFRPLSPLLIGGPGIGKNRIVYECARVTGKELYIFQGHEDVTAEDLVCAVRFSDDPAKKMDYIVSPLVTAMLRGGVCFVDEIGKIRPRALAPLASLLDERRYMDSILLGERIHAHRGFRFVAATNSDDLDDTPLPDFIRSRLRPVIAVDHPEREEIEGIIRAHFKIMKDNGVVLLDRFWDLWRQKESDRPPTPRESIDIFGYAFNLADFESVEKKRFCDLDGHPGRFNAIKELHLEKAFDVFQKNGNGKKHDPSTHIDPLSKQ